MVDLEKWKNVEELGWRLLRDEEGVCFAKLVKYSLSSPVVVERNMKVPILRSERCSNDDPDNIERSEIRQRLQEQLAALDKPTVLVYRILAERMEGE